jgi:CRISPR-associated exonuclease Cas4
MYSEDNLAPLSALQHLLFCERQCALIHLEQAWSENRLTAEGRLLHERVHGREDGRRGDARIARGLRLRSLRLGLVGIADVVEFHRAPEAGGWTPFPVEYKRGRPKPDACDKVQLAAQALCMEEMLGIRVSAGAIFYGTPRRREDVAIDDALRREAEQAAERLHALLHAGVTPPPRHDKRCQSCSLLDLCMPKACGRTGVSEYVRATLETMVRGNA